jgi:O-antigen/teichoic acid export membrane protein
VQRLNHLLPKIVRNKADFLWSFINQLGSLAAGLLLVRAISVFLPAGDFGQASLVLGLIGLLTTFFSSPLLTARLRLLFDPGQDNARSSAHKAVFRNSIFVSLIYLLIAAIAKSFGKYNYWELAIPAVMCICLSPHFSVFLNFLEAKRSFKLLAFAQIVNRLLQAAALPLFIFYFSSSTTLVLSQAVSFMVVIAALLLIDKGTGSLPVVGSAGAATDNAGFTRNLYISGLFSWLIATSDRYIIEGYLGAKAAGVYVFNYGFWSLPFTMVNAFLETIFRPRIFSAAASQNIHAARRLTTLRVLTGAAIGVFGVGLTFVLSKPISKAFFAPAYWADSVLTTSLALAFVPVIIGNALTAQLIGEKNTWPLVVASLIGAALNIVLNVLFVAKYGINFAAWSTGLAYLLWCAVLSTSFSSVWKRS